MNSLSTVSEEKATMNSLSTVSEEIYSAFCTMRGVLGFLLIINELRDGEISYIKGKIDLSSVFLLESIFFFKVNSRKVDYFSMFGNVMENKLENICQCLVML
jgi:hypothetical protein